MGRSASKCSGSPRARHTNQRYYSSVYGRFTSPDRYRNSARPGIPGSWNRYAYVLADPINHHDRRGQYVDCGDNDECWARECDDRSLVFLDDGCGLLIDGGGGGGGGGGGIDNGHPPAPPPPPPPPQCPLVAVLGNFTVAPRVTALFAPDMAAKIDSAFAVLNQEGVVPTITSGFRTAASQQAVQGSPNGSAPVGRSWHQVGEAIDLNSQVSASTFQEILSAMTNVGLTWGGTFRHKDPVHYQNALGATFPNPAQVAACAREHP